jgi:two-component system LytT family sensor kinase
MPGNKIGLLNVHHRVKLLYGDGLHIQRLSRAPKLLFTSRMSAARAYDDITVAPWSNRMKVIIVEDEFLAQQEPPG